MSLGCGKKKRMISRTMIERFTLQLSYTSSDRQWPCGSTTVVIPIEPYSRATAYLCLPYDYISGNCCITFAKHHT